MAKIKRYFENNIPYFISAATKDRTLIFRDHFLCRIFLITIEYYKIILDFKVHGYCLMPDHVHLIATATGKFNMSFIMKMVKGSFARKVNKLKNQNGSLWQPRFYEEAIRSEKQFLCQLDYMHQNPVKAGLVSDASQYPFSSFNAYHHGANPNAQILQIDPIDAD